MLGKGKMFFQDAADSKGAANSVSPFNNTKNISK